VQEEASSFRGCQTLSRYVISLLVNLNARAYRPTPVVTNETDANNIPHISTMAFTPGQNPGSNSANTTAGNGIFSFIRSIARTIHNEPNEPIVTSTEYVLSRPDAEIQQIADEVTDPLNGSQ
jgi:hypothetical protein